MTQRIQILLCIMVALGIMGYSCTQEEKEVEIHKTMEDDTVATKAEKVLRHVVLFKFKDDAPEAEVQKISDAFNALPAAIPVVKDFEWGLNDSPEDFHQGFTHCYMLTFESESDRDSIYTPHPQHQAFVKSLEPYLEKVFVVDYWTK